MRTRFGTRACASAMIGVLEPVKPLVRNANELVGLLAVLREVSNAAVHIYADADLQSFERLRENDFHAPAEGNGLWLIRLRKQEGKFIAADTESGIRSAQRFLQCRSGGAQHFIAPWMPVFVVYFLEAMQIENHEAERLVVTPRTVQFLVKRFTEESAVVETGQRVGDGVALQFFEGVIFDDHRNAKHAYRSEHVDERCFEGDRTIQRLAQFATPQEH